MFFPVPALLVLLSFSPLRTEDVDQLRTLLTRNTFSLTEVEAALEAVVAAGDWTGLEVMSAGLERFGRDLAEQESRRAALHHRLESLLVNKNADKAEIKDLRMRTEILASNAELFKLLRERVEAALVALLAKVAESGDRQSLDGVMRAYENHARRAVDLEVALVIRKGELAEIRSKLRSFKGLDPTPLEVRATELETNLEVMERDLASHDRVRLEATAAVAGVLENLTAKERSSFAEVVEHRVGRKNQIPRRIVYMDLYAGLGLEKGADELLKICKAAAREIKALDDSLEKVRKQYYSTLEAYFGQVEHSDGMVRVDLKNSFEQLTQEIQGLAAERGMYEKLRRAAGLAVGLAVRSVPEKIRERKVRWLLGEAGKGRDGETRAWVVESLARCDLPGVREHLRKQMLTDKDIKCSIAALEALVQMQDTECLETVRGKLLTDENWRVRTAAVSALRRIPAKDNVPPLIDTLENDLGRLQEDASEALVWLTGQNYRKNVALWRRWWDQNADSFQIEEVQRKRKLAVNEEDQDARGVTFYGISSDSKKICFVLDVSKSMEEPVSGRGDKRKLDVAKEELAKAVTALDNGDLFTIVVFAGTVQRYQPKMIKVTDAVKDRVLKWMERDVTYGLGTNLHAGIMGALDLAGLGAHDSKYESAIDTIFFLSDGDPTVGEVIDTDEIRRLVRDRNRLSRIRIHTVGVGDGANVAFLYGLAEDSGGLFVLRR